MPKLATDGEPTSMNTSLDIDAFPAPGPTTHVHACRQRQAAAHAACQAACRGSAPPRAAPRDGRAHCLPRHRCLSLPRHSCQPWGSQLRGSIAARYRSAPLPRAGAVPTGRAQTAAAAASPLGHRYLQLAVHPHTGSGCGRQPPRLLAMTWIPGSAPAPLAAGVHTAGSKHEHHPGASRAPATIAGGAAMTALETTPLQ